MRSRSSTSSIFRSRHPSESSLSGYDSESIITFRPAAAPPTSTSSSTLSLRSRHHRPPDLHIAQHRSSQHHKISQAPSLPVTPGTPPTPSAFPLDPFSHPTTLPQSTRNRPGSLAHGHQGHGHGHGRVPKGPEIVVASPSTSTIHYLFPTAPSCTGNHLTATGLESATSAGSLSRTGSRRRKEDRKGSIQATSGVSRQIREEGRTSRFASEPAIGISDSASMRTLRRQPSIADLGAKARGKDTRGKENAAPGKPLTLAGVVEEKRNKAMANKMASIPAIDTRVPPAHSIAKSAISTPIAADTSRRRSLSLSSPRPAPAVPLAMQASPQLPRQSFGRPVHIDVGDIGAPGAYAATSAGVAFTNPFAFPGGVAMSRGTTKLGCGGAMAGQIAMRQDAERRFASKSLAEARDSITDASHPLSPTEQLSRRPSLSKLVRQSLSLKSSGETKANRRRSQSVTTRGERRWDIDVPIPMTPPSSMIRALGLGDPGVDLGDKYALAKIPLMRPSGLQVSIDDALGQRSPQRKRIDLGGSEISLLAPSTVGLGFSPLDSPISLPRSLVNEAVDLTERGRKVASPMSSTMWTADDASGSEDDVSTSGGAPSFRTAPIGSTSSTPYLQTQSQGTSPLLPLSNMTSPMPQTPNSFGRSPRMINIAQPGSGLGSPVEVSQTPAMPDNETKYAVGSRKPNLRYSKSFTSDVGQKLSRKMSWRSKPVSQHLNTVRETLGSGQDEMETRKEKRLSRSWSSRLKTRSPVPSEMRTMPSQLLSPISDRRPSNPDSYRWRTPTMYTICSPDGAIEPLPTPNVSVTAPNSPDPAMSGLTPSTSRSPFLAASSSIRGSFRSLTKSISRTFDRHHASDQVKQADSALKAKISSPLEATRERLRTDAGAGSAERCSGMSTSTARAAPLRGGSKEWREGLLTQAVSHSIKEGLHELAGRAESAYDPASMGRRSDRTSWSRSVGKTFGLGFRDSRLTSAGAVPVDRTPSGLAETGKQDSSQSIYSLLSVRPHLVGAFEPPCINISQPTPQPKRQHPNFSLPTPQSSYRPAGRVASGASAGVAPSQSSRVIYRPPTPPSVDVSAAPTPNLPQAAVLDRISAISAQQSTLQGKDDRLKKVLRWRRGIDSLESSIDQDDADDDSSDDSGIGHGGEEDGLQGMIARHVEDEKEVLKSIVRRRSLGPVRNMGTRV